ncbi:11656_t:CDS:2, partial [Gigaspora rosea]
VDSKVEYLVRNLTDVDTNGSSKFAASVQNSLHRFTLVGGQTSLTRVTPVEMLASGGYVTVGRMNERASSNDRRCQKTFR